MTKVLDLTTPSLLFSAISLILLAYTNRFISYAQLVRNLQDKHEINRTKEPNSKESKNTLKQINNLVIRLELIRAMQILGAGSLLFCITSMFFIYIGWPIVADWTFGFGMILLALSLTVCILEIQISVKALYYNLQTISNDTLFSRLIRKFRWYYKFGSKKDRYN